MQRMLEKGATPQEIEEYATLEGVTPDQVNPRSVGQQIGDYFSEVDDELSGFQKSMREKVVGRQDPEYADLPTYPADQPAWHGAADVLGGVLTDNDKDYAAIIKQELGDRFVGSKRDKNGYEIITYRGDDGEEYVAYINKPGLDLSDVNRELMNALPAAVTGLGIATLGRKLGLGAFGRITTMFGGEATTSGAQDVAAATQGAEFDPVKTLMKMGMAGAGGALFEGLSGPMTRGWRKIFRGKEPVVDSTGSLTPAARQMAVEAGLDPEDMNARLAAALQREMTTAADPTEVGTKIRTGEFGIPSTEGQRTKRPNLLSDEERLRQGNLGPEAQRIMEQFDTSQKSAIDRAVDDSIGMSLAPNQGGRERQTLGTRIQEGVRSAKGVWDAENNRLWGQVKGPLFPDPRYRQQTILDSVKRNLVDKDVFVDNITTPGAVKMMDQLQEFAEGKAISAPHRLLEQAGQNKELGVDEMRRRLWTTYDALEPGTADKRAAGRIYDAYLEWIDDVSDRGAINATPEEIAALKVARGFHRDIKSLFEPRTGGKPNAAAKKLQAVMEDGRTSSAEDVLNALLGAGGPAGGAPKGTVQALRHMRGILSAAGDVGKDTWNDVRLAYWVKLVQDRKAQTLSPRKLRDNIETAFANQKSVLDVLYTPEEQKTMRRLARALDDVVYKPPNPSGSGYEVERALQRQRKPGFLEDQIQWRKRRASLSGNTLNRMFFKFLGDRMPNVAGARDFGGGRLAKRAVDQNVAQIKGSPLIAPAGAIGARELGELEFADDQYPEGVE